LLARAIETIAAASERPHYAVMTIYFAHPFWTMDGATRATNRRMP